MLNLYDLISNTRIFKTFKVNDLLFVEYRCLTPEKKTAYWINNNCMVFVSKGKKKWEDDQKEYLVEAGNAIFLKKGAYIVHQYFDDDFCALLIFIPDDFIKNVVQYQLDGILDHIKKAGIDSVITVDMDEILLTYFHSMMSYFVQPDPPPKNLLKIKFTELILNIMNCRENNDLKGCLYRIAMQSKISISEIMEANFTYNLKLEEFARLCGRSLSSFKRDFIDLYGESPGRWLKKKRLDHTRILLENTSKSITDIAYESGFESRSHFIRTFKQKFGEPPLKFKRNLDVV